MIDWNDVNGYSRTTLTLQWEIQYWAKHNPDYTVQQVLELVWLSYRDSGEPDLMAQAETMADGGLEYYSVAGYPLNGEDVSSLLDLMTANGFTEADFSINWP